MHDYLSLCMMIQPINEASLILFDVSSEEKARIVRQYNRALQNAQGDGTDVAQIFLKPLISQYQKWGDPALIFGLCLAREGQFKRAEGSLAFAIQGVLGTEQYLTIAQEALRMVREDIKNPPEDLPPADIAGKLKNAQMASGSSPAARANFQAPILMRAQKSSEAPQMASSKERRDILMRSGGVGDELPDDSIDIEDIKSPREKMRTLVIIGVVILSMLLMTLLIIFGIIPLIKEIESGGDAQDRLEYLYGEFRKNRYDPEVSAIVSAYESSYGTIFAQTPTDGTTETESQTETTETTPTETELTAYIAETTTSEETTSEEETTYEGED
ncbi:MAG: hypothetical protein IKO15_09805 [Clostridiales bacterium]|nr:hypothetical protein [Clostridiales bacterium]